MNQPVKPKFPEECSHNSDPVVCDGCRYPYEKEFSEYVIKLEEYVQELLKEISALKNKDASYFDTDFWKHWQGS